MNRRKLIIGVGSAGAGVATIFGTGAFSSVSAERTVSIETASDAQAFLGLNPDGSNYPNSGYATESNGMVKIDVSAGSEGGFDGAGVSPFASTVLEGILPVENQGTQDVEVSVTSGNLSPDDPLELFATNVPNQSGQLNLLEGASGDRPIIGPGESFALGFAIDAETSDRIDTLEDDIFDGNGLQVTITASAEEASGQ